jgi:RNA polymerase sigma factor (sigma-70 family)
MGGDTTADVHDLIERLRRGDDSARKALLERVHHRLCRIAAATLNTRFPRLRQQHELDSVVDEAWMRLMRALKTTQPGSPEAFYGLMFHKVRQVLLDLAMRQSRDDALIWRGSAGAGDSAPAIGFEAGDITDDPALLAFWTEFHQEVANLPDTERLVFDFHYYAEFPQAEIAQLLGLHPKQVSRLWLAAAGRLAEWMDGLEGLRP